MAKNDNKNKFYFFKIDRDKIKMQLKNISSKFTKPRKNKKMIGIFITFFLLVGVVIALYADNNNSWITTDYFEREQQSNNKVERQNNVEKSNETINLNTEVLTLPDGEEKQNVDELKTDKGETDKETSHIEIEGVVTEPVTDIRELEDKTTEKPQLLRPVSGEVINEPGWYFHPVFEDWRYQKGVKMEGNPGDIVMAAEGGEVLEVYEDEYKGIVVKIKHNKSWKTLYGNLQKTPLKEGEVVGKGQEVGRIGTTGIEEKPCLYFELQNNEEIVNPVGYFD